MLGHFQHGVSLCAFIVLRPVTASMNDYRKGKDDEYS